MSSPSDAVPLALLCDWMDPQSQLTRRFLLLLHESEKKVEMRDIAKNKVFLRKSPAPEALSRADLVLGSRISVYGRMLSLVDYADSYTRQSLSGDSERLGLMVTETSIDQIGRIVKVCEGFGLRLCKLRMVKSPGDTLGAGRVVGELVGGRNGVKKELEATFLEEFGSGAAVLDAFPEENDAESTASYQNTTCAVILPHVIKRGFVGDILHDLTSLGFDLSAVGMFSLSADDARKFLEVYQGVLPEFRKHVDELSSGPSLALELGCRDAVRALRDAVGPWDVEIAKEIRSHTLRAKYGIDKVRKAVHCTDLPEDSELECRFFFDGMWRSGRLA